MSTGPIDEEEIKNFNLGEYFGRYAAWSSVLSFIDRANAEISPEAREIIKKEAKKWEWLWCNSNKLGFPLPVTEWEKHNETC